MTDEDIYRKVFLENTNYDMAGSTNKNDPTYRPVADYILKNKPTTHIDVSTGRGFFMDFIQDVDLESTVTDFIDERVSTVALTKPFIKLNLKKEEDLAKLKANKYDVLTFTGVLEHFEEEYIDPMLKAFSETSDVVLVTIANHSDIQFGHELHIIQKNSTWWRTKLEKYFVVNDFSTYYTGDRLFYFELKTK